MASCLCVLVLRIMYLKVQYTSLQVASWRWWGTILCFLLSQAAALPGSSKTSVARYSRTAQGRLFTGKGETGYGRPKTYNISLTWGTGADTLRVLVALLEKMVDTTDWKLESTRSFCGTRYGFASGITTSGSLASLGFSANISAAR